MPKDVTCRNCGVQLRRRWGRWQHVVRLGPVPCPAAEPEPATDNEHDSNGGGSRAEST